MSFIVNKLFKIKLFFVLWQIICEMASKTFSAVVTNQCGFFSYLLYIFSSKEGLDLFRVILILCFNW